LKLIQTKTNLPEHENFGIQYGCAAFELRNNVPC
jgi:hypothetical protein